MAASRGAAGCGLSWETSHPASESLLLLLFFSLYNTEEKKLFIYLAYDFRRISVLLYYKAASRSSAGRKRFRHLVPTASQVRTEVAPSRTSAVESSDVSALLRSYGGTSHLNSCSALGLPNPTRALKLNTIPGPSATSVSFCPQICLVLGLKKGLGCGALGSFAPSRLPWKTSTFYMCK